MFVDTDLGEDFGDGLLGDGFGDGLGLGDDFFGEDFGDDLFGEDFFALLVDLAFEAVDLARELLDDFLDDRELLDDFLPPPPLVLPLRLAIFTLPSCQNIRYKQYES